jgi:uncharacterized peroxidase-related enzyme
MPRISEIDAENLPAEARQIFDRYISEYGPFENQAKIFAQRPPALRHIMGLLLELMDEAVLPKRYLEIALVTVSKINACEYCVAHHGPRMTSQGFDSRAFDHLLDETVPGFDEVDHLVRDYAVEVTNNFQYMRDAIFDRLKEHFSEAQIFELTLRIALCGFFNRVNDSLQIEMEDGVVEELEATGASLEGLSVAD